jgi:dTDP-D-glucose 4,6-dehydratase
LTDEDFGDLRKGDPKVTDKSLFNPCFPDSASKVVEIC